MSNPQILVEQYLRYLTVVRNCSGHTLSAYKREIFRFADFLQKPLAQGTPQDVTAFISKLRHKDLSSKSIQRNLSAIRTKEWKYVHFPSLPPLLFNILEDPYETNNLANKKDYLEIQNNLLSKLLSHRMLHQERQLSNAMLSKSGMKINSGPNCRRIKN